MKKYENSIGVNVPNILLPGKDADYYKWAVVACDQFTSQPSYWEEAERITSGAPSTLHLILPEAYLGKDGEKERIEDIKRTMREYLDNKTVSEIGEGFVLVTRSVAGNTRRGLVLALDLEEYDYNKGATTLIRATEGTIVSRIPPRLKIREGAALELPHILVLIDDPDCTVIEPLAKNEHALPLLYDTELMQEGGHITGRFVGKESEINAVLAALSKLADKAAFDKKYPGKAPFLFAMGDGNHSFATAKAYWEETKKTVPESEWADHPARYALVEIENVHDDGIVFEPIHRVVFGAGDGAIEKLAAILSAQNGGCTVSEGEAKASGGKEHVIPFFYGKRAGAFTVVGPKAQLAVGTLQNAIDAYLKETPAAEVDYIHGEAVVKELSEKPGAMGFLLPAMEKSELFPTVVYDGALPRKTFSMGEANEKRYYLETRKIVK